jgi:sialic acid synthase SpsE
MDEVNLRAMITLARAFKVSVGYSDHTPGIEIPMAAAALGAKVIEKHFTLDRELPGPDHKASLEPGELKAMVSGIRNISAALGDGVKRPTRSEVKNMAVARKSIVAKKAIRKGETFSEANLTCKRPGTGLSPMRWDELIGKPSPADFAEDQAVSL